MFVVKAALVTNHPELGIRVQPYTCGPTLAEVALQFSLIQGRKILPRTMRWMCHGNLMFIYADQPGYRTFHFNPCEGHELSFDGPTLVFFCPMSKQDQASQLSLAGSWSHIADSFKPGDEQNLQPLFSHGHGSIELPSTKDWLTAVGDPARPPGASGRAKGTGEKFGEGDHMTELFDGLSEAGFDVKLLRDDNGTVLGLAAIGEPPEPLIERDLCEDPGFYSDRPEPAHCVSLAIVAEVSFDPMHYPSPSSFVMALMAGYARALHLNIDANHLEPEYGLPYLDEMHEFINIVEQQREAEPAYGVLESPLIAKLPDEPGGMGR